MGLKASEISRLIKERIKSFEITSEARDVGTVIGVTDGTVKAVLKSIKKCLRKSILKFLQIIFGIFSKFSQKLKSFFSL